jgi:hypothetical protein
MTTPSGNIAPNQFIVSDGIKDTFQSYKTVICEQSTSTTLLDINALSYSNTTSKYLFKFLGETRKEIEAKIKSGEYILADLNA